MIKSTASLTAIKSAKIIATHILRPSLIISKPLTSTTGKTNQFLIQRIKLPGKWQKVLQGAIANC